MASVIGLGTLAWNWMFADYKPSEMRNAIILINVVAWGLQFVGHGVFESTLLPIIFREKASFDGQHFPNLLSPSLCNYRIVRSHWRQDQANGRVEGLDRQKCPII